MMLAQGGLLDFVTELVTIYGEEEEEKALWEVWLHKVDGKSFAAFKREVTGRDSMNEAPKTEDITKAVKESFEMLSGFAPDGGVEGDGAF